jgi:hypothetical protein
MRGTDPGEFFTDMSQCSQVLRSARTQSANRELFKLALQEFDRLDYFGDLGHQNA